MKSRRFISYSVAAAGMAAVLFLLLLPKPAAQETSVPPPGSRGDLALNAQVAKPTPRLPDGHPNLNGFWEGAISGITQQRPDEQILTRTPEGSIFFDYGGAGEGTGAANGSNAPRRPANQPSYKPEYFAKAQQIAATMYEGSTNIDPIMDCKPMGVPRVITEHPQMQIVQTSDIVAVLTEATPGPAYRVIYTDGREHPKDLDTSFLGHSIGHWEGDTLVVDTVGLNDETWLADPRQGNLTTIHSDKEHVTERWTRKGDIITYEATVDDPVMFTKPWVITPHRLGLAAKDDYIQPQTCTIFDKGHFVPETEAEKAQHNGSGYVPPSAYGLPDDSNKNSKK